MSRVWYGVCARSGCRRAVRTADNHHWRSAWREFAISATAKTVSQEQRAARGWRCIQRPPHKQHCCRVPNRCPRATDGCRGYAQVSLRRALPKTGTERATSSIPRACAPHRRRRFGPDGCVSSRDSANARRCCAATCVSTPLFRTHARNSDAALARAQGNYPRTRARQALPDAATVTRRGNREFGPTHRLGGAGSRGWA